MPQRCFACLAYAELGASLAACAIGSAGTGEPMKPGLCSIGSPWPPACSTSPCSLMCDSRLSAVCSVGRSSVSGMACAMPRPICRDWPPVQGSPPR